MTVPSVPSFVTMVESKNDTSKITPCSAFSSWCSRNWKAILAELISTMLLLSLGCMTCIPLDGFTPQPALYAPLGFGFVVMFNVQTFGHLSGAHMNPCITIVGILWGKTPIVLGIAYMIAQFIGAILGSWIMLLVSPVDVVSEAVCVTQPHGGLNVTQALIVEVILTAALCLITCAVWDPVNEQKQDSAPIKFGLTIAALSIAGGPLTGASMNPARSLGPALVTGVWNAYWIYCAGPLIGTILATVIYIYIWREKKDVSM